MKLKICISLGPDGVHPIMLKSCKNILEPLINDIFMKSYSTDAVPTDFTSIFKKVGSRPISVTAVTCTIMKRMVRDEKIDGNGTN